MSGIETGRTIVAVEGAPPAALTLHWSDGACARIDVSGMLLEAAFRDLRDPDQFANVRVGEWGHSVEWPCGVDLGAESLWLETLSATGRDDTRAFLEWRLRHGLSLSASAAALGLARRTVAYYSNGERRIPKPVLLACRGWEALRAAA